MYHENDPGVSADSVSCGFSVRIAGNLATCRKVAEKSGSFSVTFLKAKKNVLPIWHIPFLLFVWIPKEGSDLSFGAGSSNRGAEHPCWLGNPKGPAPPLAGRIQRNRRFRGRESNGDSVPLAHDFACKVIPLRRGWQRTACFARKDGAKEDGRGLELRSDYSGRRQPGPAPEQRDTVPAAHHCPHN